MENWQFTPFATLYFAALLVTATLSVVSFRYRSGRGARLFSGLCISISVWTLGFILGFFSTDLAWKLLMVRLEYLGITLTAPLFLLFVISYTQLFTLNLVRVTALVAIPAITFASVLTFTGHELFYLDHQLASLKDGFVVFRKDYGPLFYLWVGYSYLVTATSAVALAWSTYRMPPPFRSQSFPFAALVLVVLAANFSFISGYNLFAPYDATPLAFAIVCVLTMFLMRSYRFLDITPVAHNTVFRQINTGVLVFDDRGLVMDANEEVLAILSRTLSDTLGESVTTLIPELDHFATLTADRTEISLGGHYYELEVRSLRGASERIQGYIALLYDVSERRRMSEEQARLIGELQRALDEVKTLQGLVPICASCKNIRDDTGFWHNLETFMAEHSNATFSHGICPACSEKLYGDLIQDSDDKPTSTR